MSTPTDDGTRDTLLIENPALRKGFTIIPNYVLCNPKLSFGARLTYTLLLSYAWQEGSCFPGQQKLAGDLQTDPRSVRRYLAELKAERLVQVERRGLGQTNVYILTDPGLPCEPDRTGLSALDRTPVSDPDRTVVSDKEDSGREDSERQRLSADNRLAVKEVSDGTRASCSRIGELLTRRPPPVPGWEIADKRLEVGPMVEAAARKLRATSSLGLFYKVLLQLYPEHGYLFERAVKEAAEEPKLRVSRTALFTHIVRRLAREHSVHLRLGPAGDSHQAGERTLTERSERGGYPAGRPGIQ